MQHSDVLLLEYNKNKNKLVTIGQTVNVLMWWKKTKRLVTYELLFDEKRNNYSSITSVYWIAVLKQGGYNYGLQVLLFSSTWIRSHRIINTFSCT